MIVTTHVLLHGATLMQLASCQHSNPKHDLEAVRPQHAAGEAECICLIERVSHALRRTGHSTLHNIGVCVRGDAVFLEGRVASFHLKQLAQEAVRQVFNNAIIKNELEVTS